MGLYRKSQNAENVRVYRDVKPTLLKIAHRLDVTYTGTPDTQDYWVKEEDVLAMLPTDSKVPDFKINLCLHAALSLDMLVSNGTTHMMHVNPNGFMYFSDEVPKSIDSYTTYITIEGVESLQDITISMPDIPISYQLVDSETLPRVKIYVKTGGSWTAGPITGGIVDNTSKTLSLTADSWQIEGSQIQGVKIEILWATTMDVVDLGTPGCTWYQFWNTKSAVILDFNNAWEDPLVSGSIGVITGLISTAVLETVARKLASSAAVQQIAASFSITAMEIAVQYVSCMVYFTSMAKTRTLEDFSLEELTSGPLVLQALLKMGIGAGYPILKNLTGDHRATQLTRLLGGLLTGVTMAANVASSVGLTCAYLTTMGINAYFFYW